MMRAERRLQQDQNIQIKKLCDRPRATATGCRVSHRVCATSHKPGPHPPDSLA